MWARTLRGACRVGGGNGVARERCAGVLDETAERETPCTRLPGVQELRRGSAAGCASTPSAILSANAARSTFHQRHIGRVVRSSCNAADEDMHRHAIENIVHADALLLGRVTYEMMEAARGGRRAAGRERGLIGWNPSPGRSMRQRISRSSTLDVAEARSSLARA